MARFLFTADYAFHILKGKTFIYIDETRFNAGLMPIYGYSKIGKRCFYKGKPNKSIILLLQL